MKTIMNHVNNLKALECKVLDLLNQEYTIDHITKSLDIKDDDLAYIIIGLDEKDLIILKDKKWIITDKGKDILKEILEKRDMLLKNLKVKYMHGEINGRDEYNRRKKELEDMSQIISITPDSTEKDIRVDQKEVTEIIDTPETITEKKGEDWLLKDEKPKEESAKKKCSKCGIENKLESNYCRKCGTVLNK